MMLGEPELTDARPAAQQVNVVLVHGILDTGRIFDPLVRRLQAEGCHCLAPSLQPNNCRDGVRALTVNLQREIDAHFEPAQEIVLVGFSMGGIITRDYVQNLAQGRRIRAVFLISTPNKGSIWASLAPGRGGVRDLSYRSPFLQTLNEDETAWQNIPVTSYWTPFDLMIIPAHSSRWPIGESMTIACPLHPMMPANGRVVADITSRIAALGL